MTAVWDLKSQFEQYKDKQVFDCFLAEYLLSEGKYALTQEETFKRYNCKTLEELASKQQQALKENNKLQSLYNEIELPLVSVLYYMEKKGILLDTDKLKHISEEIDKEIDKLITLLKQQFGDEINFNSSVQIGNHLAEKEGVPLGRTKTGKYATNEGELIKHQNQFPIIQLLLEYRELTKLKSTYIDSLIQKVGEDKRIHTTYTQAGISTGRLASSNPNLQNIPVTSEFGRKIKSCFCADDNYTLVSFDYSQQELRILAHLTQEDKLIEAFKHNRDVHKLTASQLFHTDYDNVTKEERSIAKTINFGIIYGMGGFGLSQSLH